MVRSQPRQALWSCFRCWDVQLPEKHLPAQAVLACTFGRGKGGKAGKSNEAIAREVENLATLHSLPYCVQSEVRQAMTIEADGYVSAPSYDSHGRGYVGTWQTVQEMVENFCKSRNISRVIVVAHPAHLWRVVRVCEQLGLQVVAVSTEDIPYDHQSTQLWCRSAWNFFRTLPYPPFIPYEVIARLHYLRQGWLCARKIHYWHLNREAAERMKGGEKLIEARLNDEERREVRVGDIVQFLDRDNDSPLIRIEVTALLPYPTFDQLLDDYSPEQYFNRSREELLPRLRKPTGYYSWEDEQQYGVVGLMIKVID